MISYILAVISAVLLLGADQLTKYSVSTEFALGEQREFLKGFIDLTYIHNRGGAWGMLYGKTYILIPVTVIVMAVCIILYKKYGKKNKLLPCTVGRYKGKVNSHSFHCNGEKIVCPAVNRG